MQSTKNVKKVEGVREQYVVALKREVEATEKWWVPICNTPGVRTDFGDQPISKRRILIYAEKEVLEDLKKNFGDLVVFEKTNVHHVSLKPS